jgi:hypothetical protein
MFQGGFFMFKKGRYFIEMIALPEDYQESDQKIRMFHPVLV